MKTAKSTIWLDAGKTKLAPYEKYSAEKRLICWLHLKLADIVQKSEGLKEEERQEMFELLDDAFNAGKRMGNKLAFYRKIRNAIEAD